MNKIIIVSTDCYFELEEDCRRLFKEIVNKNTEIGNPVCFISRTDDKLDLIKNEFSYNEKVRYRTRDQIKKLINDNEDKKHYFIVVGNRDKDFQLAVNNKFLLLVPLWTNEIYEKCKKYGIKIKNLEILDEVIKTIYNQNSFYYELELPDSTKIYSLISAHTKTSGITKQEKELVQGFEDFLKRGKITYYEILLYHFLASIANNPEFRDIQSWAIMPSSSLELNDDMLNFKEKARYIMKGQVPRSISSGKFLNNIFLRHTKVQKSHSKSHAKRMEEGCKVHFDSICLNEAYKKKTSNLEGKNICVFDDYLTNGNSFECLRNLLRAAGVNKIICVSLGRFRRPYYYQDFEVSGDLFTPNGFTYRLNEVKEINSGTFNDEARREVKKLHDIFNL